MSLPTFLVPSLTGVGGGGVGGGILELDGDEGRHAVAVRRIRPGERVALTDGAGTTAVCEVATVGKASLTASVLDVRTLPPATPRVVAVQAIAKGDRSELAVELLTEVGVDVIVPWAASRCVAVWRGDRAERSLARWRSTARESAKQARRSWFPDVTAMASTDEVASRLAHATLPVVLHESATRALAELEVPEQGDIVVVVGPEGGISEEELSSFAAAGVGPVRLGDTVLRTSSAGVAAVAALLSRTGRWH
jgi:16S rRNA (uracil1498-N3)-methyltransferase